MRAHPAAGDCERLRAGVVAQPVNAASSLAYVAAGAWLWRRFPSRADARAFAALVAANGVGGVAFHGPGDRASHWLHDTALVGTLAAIVVERPSWTAGATVAAGVGLAVRPTATNAASAVGVALVAGAEVRRGRRPAARTGALLVAAAAVNVLSRTGGRCCRPASVWQGHALWHVLTAAALADWGRQAFSELDDGRSPAGGR